MRVEDIQPIQDFLALLDDWRTEAASVGVELRQVTINLPPINESTFKHNATYVYDDSGMEDPLPHWSIAPSGI